MLQRPVDWQHWVLAGGVIALLLWTGWRYLTRTPPAPTAVAPAGAQPRTRDAL